MTIKEVEQILEIPKATLRFYEKEGLVEPQRGANTYREYSDADVELLKKVIILRKIGVSVEDIKGLLAGRVSLQDTLVHNISDLQNQMKEIEGAMRICTLMQEKEESIASLDEEYYWDVIHTEEQKGNKFFEIVSDIVDFEKRMFWEEFGIADINGKLNVSPKKAVLIVCVCCVAAGLVWYFLDGMQMKSFVMGMLYPFVCILIYSVFGLPFHFLEKKNAKLAKIVKRVGLALAVVIILLLIFIS